MAQYTYTLNEDYSFAGGVPSKPFKIHESMIDKMDSKYVSFFNESLCNNEAILATHRVPLKDIRAGGNVIPGQTPMEEMEKIYDIKIPRKYTKGEEIDARVFIPKEPKPPQGWPLLVWFHGGGWVLGGLDTENSFCTKAAKNAKCMVISVDYRLAPEFPFPACIDDAFEAVMYAFESADQLNVNNAKIALAGSSAGGHLTAVITHKYANSELSKNLPPICFQFQVVPVTDNTATPETQISWKENEFTTQLPAEKMLWYRRLFLPNPQDAFTPEASPLLYSDESFTKVPPCFIAASECDVLRSEAQAYGEKLKRNGVKTEVVIYKGMPHTTMVMDGVLDQGKQLVSDTTSALYHAFYPDHS